MTKEELKIIWQEFGDQSSRFDLSPKEEDVDMLANGVLENEKNHGLKYCPCRVRTSDKEKDNLLVCPCNFFIQKTWEEKGECWCGLFVKSKNK